MNKSPGFCKNTSLENELVGPSQTVESVDESSGQFISFQKPPSGKKIKSVNRKKESVIKKSSSLMGKSSFSTSKTALLQPPSYFDEKNE